MRFRRSFRSVLDDCLSAMRQGESLDACLARYPRDADRLRPLLTLAQRVGAASSSTPRAWAQTAAWNAVRQRAAGLRSGRRHTSVRFNAGAWLRPAAVVMSVLLAAGLGMSATALAAQDALPGDTLYGVKLATEDVRVFFTFSETGKADALMDQSDERVEEIESLVKRGDPVPGNVLSLLENRHSRAAEILDRPEETKLRTRLLAQAESEEKLLIALWPDVKESARGDYTAVVAAVHNTRLAGTGALAAAIQPEDLAGGVSSTSGEAQQLGESEWTVAGKTVEVDERTIGSRDLTSGATASFVIATGADGKYRALSVSRLNAGTPPSGAVVSGEIEQVTDGGIWIGGQFIPITPETLLKLKLSKGERVDVHVDDGKASAVAPAGPVASGSVDLLFEGTIETAANDGGEWTIGGVTFQTTETIPVDATAGNAEEGARALVEASVTEDGIEATRIKVLKGTEDAELAVIIGTLQDAKGGTWKVGGINVKVQGANAPATGSLVAVEAERRGTNLVMTGFTPIQKPDESLVSMQVTLASIRDSTWKLDLSEVSEVQVTGESTVSGDPFAGARVLLWGEKPDGGAFQVTYALVLDQKSAATPAATPTPSSSPRPTPAP